MNIQLDVVIAYYNNLHFINLLDHMLNAYMDITPIIYNKSSSKKAKENLYDGRPFLGLPNWFKGAKLPKK